MPRDLPLETSSTSFINDQLSTEVVTETLSLLDEDNEYVKVEVEDFKEYEKVSDHINFNTSAYTPSELNKIIFRLYNEKYIYQKENSFKDPALGFSYHVFENEGQKIILFTVVSDYKDKRENLACLEEALHFYKNNATHHQTDTLIIPIAELGRRHFRLLTIIDNHIQFYDSKTSLICQSMRFLSPLLPAASIAIKEIQKAQHQKHTDSWKFIELLSLVGIFAYQTASHYPSYFDQVIKTCHKYFPDFVFAESALGHQPYNEHTNCGPYTAAYANLVADKLSPADMTEDMIELRARFSGYKQPAETITLQTSEDGQESHLSLRT